MKMIKTYVFLFFVLIFSVNSIFAQQPEQMTKIVTVNLIESLNHQVDGVVAASIYNSIFLPKYYPEARMERVLEELNEIALNSQNPSLRYKAQLAVLYITNYGNEELKLENYKKNQSELFREISEKLQNSFLAANQN